MSRSKTNCARDSTGCTRGARDTQATRLCIPELPSVHPRAPSHRGPVREALAEAGPQATAIDLACSEGWFRSWPPRLERPESWRIDLRGSNVRRARVVRNHLGVADEARRRQGDIYALEPVSWGFRYVVLCSVSSTTLRIVGALRRARALAGLFATSKSQLTRRVEPHPLRARTSSSDERAEESLAMRIEADALTNPWRPRRAWCHSCRTCRALEAMVLAAGFKPISCARRAPAPRQAVSRRRPRSPNCLALSAVLPSRAPLGAEPVRRAPL